MNLVLATIVIDVADPATAATFWTAALGYEQTSTEDGWVSLKDPNGRGVTLGLQRRDDAKTDVNRTHIDLSTNDIPGEVRRLEALGAKRADWAYYPKDANWVVMLDPDGNEFCIVPA